jgi:hypothetical protein
MSFFPNHFQEVMLLAAGEVAIRGIGAAGEYDYTIRDTLAVAQAWDNYPNATDADVWAILPSHTAKRLNAAYRRYKDRMAAKEKGK